GRRCSRDEFRANLISDRVLLARRAYRLPACADEHGSLRSGRSCAVRVGSGLTGNLMKMPCDASSGGRAKLRSRKGLTNRDPSFRVRNGMATIEAAQKSKS